MDGWLVVLAFDVVGMGFRLSAIAAAREPAEARSSRFPIHPVEQFAGRDAQRAASFISVSTRQTRSPRSIWPTAVRCSEAMTASSSWESFARLRQ